MVAVAKPVVRWPRRVRLQENRPRRAIGLEAAAAMRHSPAMTRETETSAPAVPAEAGKSADRTAPDRTAPDLTADRPVAQTAEPAAAGPADRAADEAPCGPEDERPKPPAQKPGEIGGPAGPEPTRYGDWEVGGRCSDF